MQTRLAICAAAVVGLTVGLSAQNRQDLQVNADLRILQEQVQKLQLALNQLGDHGKATDGRLDTVASASQRSFADQKVATDQITNTLSTLREKADENNTRVLQMTQEIAALREGLRMVTTQLNTLVAVLQPAINPADPNATAGAASPLGNVVVPPSPGTFYRAAETDYMSGKYDLAISGFRDVIDKFPTSPFAADAQYFIAESYYHQAKCQQALPEYDLVTKNYRESSRVTDALLMQGFCYEDLKQPAKATQIYNQVIKLYPDSDAAIQAKQRLLQKN